MFRNLGFSDSFSDRFKQECLIQEIELVDLEISRDAYKLYVIGGSDGSHSLSSVEVLDLGTDSHWFQGPPLNVPRANVGLALLHDGIYAVGGFSGKAFLNSMEMLGCSSNEWRYKFDE